MSATDSFSPRIIVPASAGPAIRQVDLRATVKLVSIPEVPEVSEIAGVVDGNGNVVVAAAPATPSIPARTELQTTSSYEFYILDENGQHYDLRAGDYQPHLNNAEGTLLQAVLDALWAKAQGAV